MAFDWKFKSFNEVNGKKKDFLTYSFMNIGPK